MVGCCRRRRRDPTSIAVDDRGRTPSSSSMTTTHCSISVFPTSNTSIPKWIEPNSQRREWRSRRRRCRIRWGRALIVVVTMVDVDKNNGPLVDRGEGETRWFGYRSKVVVVVLVVRDESTTEVAESEKVSETRTHRLLCLLSTSAHFAHLADRVESVTVVATSSSHGPAAERVSRSSVVSHGGSDADTTVRHHDGFGSVCVFHRLFRFRNGDWSRTRRFQSLQSSRPSRRRPRRNRRRRR